MLKGSTFKFIILTMLAAVLNFCCSVDSIWAQSTDSEQPGRATDNQELDEGDSVQDEGESSEDAGKSDGDKSDENGQADLDKAFELKIAVSSTRDLDRIADLCESAIEKGLDTESEAQAKQLWSSVLYEHAKQLNRRIAPNGVLSTRWRWLRSQAVSRLNKAIELKPDKVDALILLAKLHSLNNGDREAASAAIEKAIEQIVDDNAKLSEALYIRARLADDESTRIADLTQAVKIDPSNTEALMQRALYFLRKEENENAMKDFIALLEKETETIDRHVLISQALRQRGLYEEAAKILDLAVGVDGENDDLYVLRGQAYLAAEKTDKALADLNKALDINRLNPDALNLRARLYLIEEEFDKALSDANELIQQQPEGTEGLYLRSLVYRGQRDLEKAIQDMRSMMEKVPDNIDFKLDLAILLNANNQPSKAIPIFDEILAILPEEAKSQIYRNRADAFLSQGRHEEAIDDYETALDLLEEFEGSEQDGMSDERAKDTKVGVLNNLAWVLATSPDDSVRDGKQSIEMATEASELTDYKAAYILSTLASGYAETGDFETAKKWASKAVELAESDEQREGLQEELDSYKEDKPWRESEDVEGENKEKEDENTDPKKPEDDKANNEDSKESNSEEESEEDKESDVESDDSKSKEDESSGSDSNRR